MSTTLQVERQPGETRWAGVSQLEMPEPVTSTVTFLFTDVEGSTRMWESDPAAMRRSLSRHDVLVRESVERHRGRVILERGEGDSVFAVFQVASDAVAAALAIQQAILSEQWPATTPIQVRVAIHTGEAEMREGSYYGAPVNRCARLRAIAHGGQVLLSGDTAGQVDLALPYGASLFDLGFHRLKDLLSPLSVYQLRHQDLQPGFPPLRSLTARANNLPQQLTRFIGRRKEIADVRRLLGETRLLTVVGSGGAGKTRLTLQAAAELLDDVPDGVWFLELAPLILR